MVCNLAQMIVDSGALQLALKYMKKNPDGCGVAAAKIIDDLARRCPRKTEEILVSANIETTEEQVKESGLSIICQTLSKNHTRPDISAAFARTVNILCDVSPKCTEGLAHCGASQNILTALQCHPTLSVVKLHENERFVFPMDCVESLVKFAKFDGAFLDSIKQDGVVNAVALAVCQF